MYVEYSGYTKHMYIYIYMHTHIHMYIYIHIHIRDVYIVHSGDLAQKGVHVFARWHRIGFG